MAAHNSQNIAHTAVVASKVLCKQASSASLTSSQHPLLSCATF